MIEKEEITGTLNAHQSHGPLYLSNARLNGGSMRSDRNKSANMYAQYLREVQAHEPVSPRLDASIEVDSARDNSSTEKVVRSSVVGDGILDFVHKF
jgi:hypothetical protein